MDRTTAPLKGLVIRTSVVRDGGVGYLYCGDPVLEQKGTPHAISFRVVAGAFSRGEANFDVSSCCIISVPCPGLVCVAGAGYYSVLTAQGNSAGDLFVDSSPTPDAPRAGGIRPVRDGAIWRRDASTWQTCASPTTVGLTSVLCAADGWVYAAGQHGVLLKGRVDQWTLIEHGATDDSIWGMAWFQGALYASTLNHVYRLQDDALVPVDFGTDRPISCYQLSACGDALWASGEFDVMSFDGRQWTQMASIER